MDKINQVWHVPNLLLMAKKGKASTLEIPGHRYHSSPDPWKSHNVVRRGRWWDVIVQPIRLKLQSYLAAILVHYGYLTYTARLISFSSEDLARLKDLAWKASLSSSAETFKEGENPTFISTSDVVAALIYICILNAWLSVHRRSKPSFWNRILRMLHFREISSLSISPGQEEVQMTFPKNLRSYFRPPLDRDTMGNIFVCTQVGFPLSSLTPPSIELDGLQARRVRAAIQTVDLAYMTRVTEALRSVPDMRCVGYSMDKQWGIVPTSWREQDMGQLGWGKGIKVKVEGARMPKLHMGGYFIVCPQCEDERLDVAVSLSNAEMKALQYGKEGQLLREWGRWMD